MTPAIYLLLITNIAMYLLEIQVGDAIVEQFALWPSGYGFEAWQLVTSGFVHANLPHLVANMFGLVMFGRDVERTLGTRRFTMLYAMSLLMSSVTQLAVTSLMGDETPTLGASGAVFGILVAFAMMFPDRTILLIFPPIPMRARTFVTVYAMFELYAGVFGTQAGVAHFAHLGGLAGGYLYTRHWYRTHTRY